VPERKGYDVSDFRRMLRHFGLGLEIEPTRDMLQAAGRCRVDTVTCFKSRLRDIKASRRNSTSASIAPPCLEQRRAGARRVELFDRGGELVKLLREIVRVGHCFFAHLALSLISLFCSSSSIADQNHPPRRGPP